MEEKLEIQDIKELREQIQKLLNDASDAAKDFEITKNDFQELTSKLEQFEASKQEYANCFAYLFRLIGNSTDFDRNLELEKDNELLDFSHRITELSKKLKRDEAELAEKQEQLDKDRADFDKEKVDKQKLQEQWKEETLDNLKEEQAKIVSAKEELENVNKELAERKEELDNLKREIAEIGHVPANVPGGTDQRPQDQKDILRKIEELGFTAPEDAVPGHLYLCGEVSFVDVTAMPNVSRRQLQQIDEEEFQFMGKPQISFAKLPSGTWLVRPQPNLRNSINGKELTEEIELPQAAIIEMTDKHKETHKVLAYMAF